MSVTVGLGFDFGSSRLDGPASSISSPPFLPTIAPTHPAYVPHLPPRSHRGPRSLGVGKRFVSAPSPSLPPSLYDRTSNNPLAIGLGAIPINSPQLDLGLAEFSPAQHLRQKMKKRSADRGFGLGATDDLSSTTTTTMLGDVSPTIRASPTLGTGSPIMSSSSPQLHNNDMLVPSIAALSVILGLLVIGVAGWAGLTYHRRRRVRSRFDDGVGEGGYDEEDNESKYTHQIEKDSQMFSASNVVEKGLKPRSNSGSMNPTFRPTSIVFGNGKTYSRASSPEHRPTSRRVSFIDQVHTNDEEHPNEENGYGGSGGCERDRAMPMPRVMTASLTGEGEEFEEGDYYEDEGQISARSSIAVSIAPTLEPIEEEGSIASSSTLDNVRDGMDTPRPASVASTTSATSSAYTTASARSSISSLSALSILSSSFPQTPQENSSAPGSPIQNHFLPHGRSRSPSPSESPTPISKFHTRRARAQSQGVMEVKHDLLRTAVGRTMSLQPSKEVIKALRTMTSGPTEVMVMPMPMSGIVVNNMTEEEEAEEIRAAALVAEQLVAEVESAQDDDEDVAHENHVQPGSAVTYDNGAVTSPTRAVSRSTSFPAKLLSRRRSQHHTGSPTPISPHARRSEVISGGYLKRALRAFRGEEAEPLPTVDDRRLMKMNSRESIRGLVERQAQLEVYLSHLHMIQTQSQAQQAHIIHQHQHDEEELESDPYDPRHQFTSRANPQLVDDIDSSHREDMDCDHDSIWDPEGYAADLGMAFDEYYLHFEGEEDEEESTQTYEMEEEGEIGIDRRGHPALTGRHVPHIRVTSH
ncbi:hypothetical protein CI109_100953 [Kwoniella shandongensis]|uniref:Uncharacterized protein n=1 Tax=Kwoniella shandongensis TaxID=1734106 RepID=A0A5M6C4H9_9TREE|nr:uncharacterized protein CI109_001419 [Kwoniella shandongensis]KAA5530016.1 hypothetical protein CI109_001419 [Kwoniella shandongensis]